ncbi:hypothetical protein KBZ07_02390 [Cyanobium sp. BA20m-14]|nr:hypothetical protein [Cyanobium sp. BA20m-14]MCP9912265.1 hypothetical protein [Cyanobium sp. BA20m-14]
MPLRRELPAVALCGLALLTGCTPSTPEAARPIVVDTIEARPVTFRQ